MPTLRTIVIAGAVTLGASAPMVQASGSSPTYSGDAVKLIASMPSRGATMDRVRSKLGKPERVVGPVGEPPITRWVYDEFTVYFEHNRVLHSVKNRSE